MAYPIYWPSYVQPASCTMKGYAVVGVSQSPFTLSSQTQVWPGRQWQVSITMPKMSGANARAFYAWLLSLNGRQGTFLFGDPTATEPIGTALGDPTVDGNDQSGTSLATTGWTANQDTVLAAGDYFQLGSGSTARLYILTEDAEADENGDATLNFWPPLRDTPSDGDEITVESPQTTFRLDSNTISTDLSLPLIHEFTFDASEAL